MFQKQGDTKLVAVTLLILNRFSKFFTVRFSGKFAGKYLLKISPHLMCVATLPCETLIQLRATYMYIRVYSKFN